MKKIDPWKLAVILLGLVLVLVLVKKFRSPRLEGNLPAALTDIDTAKVTDLIICPTKSPRDTVRLTKTGGWKLKSRSQLLRLEQGAGPNALRVLMAMRPERMISKRKEKWNEYLVGDSTGTRVLVMAGDQVEADLMIGRSGFGQTTAASYGGPAFTYVRLYNEPEVYSIAGFFDAQFNRVLNDWRDKGFTRIKKDSITRITFQYPADSSFVAERRETKWMIGNDLTDSTAVKSYLAGLEYRNATTFAVSIPEGNPNVVVRLDNRNKVTATIDAWIIDGNWIARSSHQPETYFVLEETVRKELFPSRKKFLLPKH